MRLKESNQFQQLICELDVPYVSECSIKVLEGIILRNRQLFSLHKSALGEEPRTTLNHICSHMALPEECIEMIDEHLSDADNVHFGFEESEKGKTYKLYLEFASPFRRALETGAGNDFDLLVHLAYKWDPEKPEKRALASYRCRPSLTLSEISEKLSAIYSHSESSIPFDIATSILRFAANKMPPEDIFFTEVEEENNPRRSYDINIYDAGLMVSDINTYLSDMWRHFNISDIESDKIFDEIKDNMIGHVAGGSDRDGRGFFSIYYGAEMHKP